MTYQISMGGDDRIATLHLGDEPWWEWSDERYAIRRSESVMVNWGLEVEYEVERPGGGTAWGMCSTRDGCGVRAPGGDWVLRPIDERATMLGDTFRLERDREARRVAVSPAVEEALVPYVICGLCILLDE